MPRHGRGAHEKSKDFKGAIKKLIKDMKKWHALLVISIFLAMVGSILSLIAPNKLSNLTDTITKGITPNVEVLEEVMEGITNNFSD